MVHIDFKFNDFLNDDFRFFLYLNSHAATNGMRRRFTLETSMEYTFNATFFTGSICSIFCPKSYTVSMSMVHSVIRPVLVEFGKVWSYYLSMTILAGDDSHGAIGMQHVKLYCCKLVSSVTMVCYY